MVTTLGLAVEEELLASAAIKLARLQPTLDSKHVENVSAVMQKGGPEIIRDFVDVCDALSKDSICGPSNGSRGMPRLSSEACTRGDLVSAVDFFN